MKPHNMDVKRNRLKELYCENILRHEPLKSSKAFFSFELCCYCRGSSICIHICLHRTNLERLHERYAINKWKITNKQDDIDLLDPKLEIHLIGVMEQQKKL